MRSIPACAGEPLLCPPRTPRPWVYPRVCGGTGSGYALGCLQKGLSPRVRGNQTTRNLRGGLSPRVRGNRYGRVNLVDYSTPACAGEPAGTGVVLLPGQLSPRVRGNPSGNCTPHMRAGSIPACAGDPYGPGERQRGLSPRVRGNLLKLCVPVNVSGSIPACAGEPESIANAMGLSRVYPRVCGGTKQCLKGKTP